MPTTTNNRRAYIRRSLAIHVVVQAPELGGKHRRRLENQYGNDKRFRKGLVVRSANVKSDHWLGTSRITGPLGAAGAAGAAAGAVAAAGALDGFPNCPIGP